jgi:two-component system sensor histidine kinase DegS
MAQADAGIVASSQTAHDRFDDLHAEARTTLANATATVRGVRERYREAYLEELGRWHAARDLLDRRERRLADDLATGADAPATATPIGTLSDLASLRGEVDDLTVRLGLHQQELSKMELAQHNLDNTRLFLERGDASLLSNASGPAPSTDVQMRIVEAQEAERSRLAQEIHDGPAQGLSNAIFQVEYIEKVMEQDGRLARTELRFLRELLRRELGDVRSFISQLRPPLLEQLGLNGALLDTIENMTALGGLAIEAELEAPDDRLDETQQIVALRVAQEALQNVRKHAHATRVDVHTRLTGDDWVLVVEDDGRGFEEEAVAGSRRSFGLQFMRERAELIGATLDIRSVPDAGTSVKLTIKLGGDDTR